MSLTSTGVILSANVPVTIVLVFTMIPLIIGSAASQRSISTVSDFFICDRKMGTVLSFFTIYATWWSSFAFLGSISYFYSVGSVYWTAIAWNILFGLLYMIFGLRLSQYGRARGHITPIGFFEDIYGSKVLNTIITIIMIIFVLIYLQIQFYGGAIIIEIATKGLIPWQISALMFYIVMIIYLWVGGLRAVAWADIFYGVLIFFGMLASGIILVRLIGGADVLFKNLIETRPELILLPPNNPVAGIPMWISIFIIMPIGALMGPQMWIRMYATREKKTFHIMPLLISVATIAYLGSMLAGSAAVLLKPNGVETSDTILPLLLVENAPGWLMAIVLCCGAAACLSTANSDIHATSALLTIDVYKKYIRPRATEKHTVFVAKMIIIIFSTAAYLFLVFFELPFSIVNTGFMALCGTAQVIIPVMGALFWDKSNSIGAILGVVIGVLFTLTFSMTELVAFPVHPGLIALLVNAVIFILCGLYLPTNPETSRKITMYKNGQFEDF